MELSVFKRETKGRSALTQLRARGYIPAVIYNKNQDSYPVYLELAAFEKVLRSVAKNHLSSTVFSLSIDGKVEKAVIKEVQYNKTTYTPIHIDFLTGSDEDFVNVKIPIECKNQADSIWSKLGGVLRMPIRSYKVRCKMGSVPASFSVDVEKMEIGDTKRLEDITLPEGVSPLVNVKEVAVAIAKR